MNASMLLRRVMIGTGATVFASATAVAGVKSRDSYLSNKINSLRESLNTPVKVGDFGSGKVSVKYFQFNPTTGLVSGALIDPKWVLAGTLAKDKKSIEVNRDPENPEVFVDTLNKLFRGEGCITATSWARNPNESEKKTIEAVKRLCAGQPNLSFVILTQSEECGASQESLEDHLKYKNPYNKLLEDVSPENTGQMEAGNGSTQTKLGGLPEQKNEKAAQWVDRKLKNGETPLECREALAKDYENDMSKATDGIRNFFMHGLFGVCLSNDNVVKSLGVNRDQWVKGEIPVELSKVISSVNANLKGSPAIVTSAFLQAFQKKNGSDFRILAMKEDMNLFNADGIQIGEGRFSHSHAIAKRKFMVRKVEYDEAIQQRVKFQQMTRKWLGQSLTDLLKLSQ